MISLTWTKKTCEFNKIIQFFQIFFQIQIFYFLNLSKNEFDVENNEEWFNKSNDLINQLLNKFYEILDHEFIKIYDNLNENLLKNSIDLLQRHRILYDKNKIKSNFSFFNLLLYGNNSKCFILVLTEPPKYNQEKKIMCYPLLMCTPSLYLPSPTKTYDQDSGLFYLAYNKEELPIRQDYFYKLVIH